MSKRTYDTLKMTRTSATGFELEWQDGYLFAEQITKEEAERVVAAVNAHDDLLAALEAIEGELDTAMGEWAGVEPPYLPLSYTAIYEGRAIARAAIAKAEGRT